MMKTFKYPFKHGGTGTREFTIWKDIFQRCTNPNNSGYKNYGGRGITICTRWCESFEAFHDDMGPSPSARHSVERKDNDGPYSPENCYWATRKEQNRNKRNNHLIEYRGESRCLTEWAEILGMNRWTLLYRLDNDWSIERAFTAAVGQPHVAAGERNGLAKLTWNIVDEIRARYAAGGITQQVLATEYGVSQLLISVVVRQKVWREHNRPVISQN